MNNTTTTKSDIIKNFAQSDTDTGSPIVQVAILSHRISQVSNHLKSHPKDESTRKGLLKLVGKRRKMLEYIKQNNAQAYSDIKSKLGL